jgi:hypothetical protein
MSISPRLISVGVSAALLASAAPASAAPHSMSCTAAPATSSTATVRNDATATIVIEAELDLERYGIRIKSVRGTTMLKTGWHPITELPSTGPKTAITWANEYGQAGLNSLHYIISKGEILVYTALSRRECGPHGSRCAAPNNTIREVYYGKCEYLV